MAEPLNTEISDAVLTQHLRTARVGTATRQAVLRLLGLLEEDLVAVLQVADPSAPALLRARQLILDQLLGDEIRPLVQSRYETISELTQTAATRLAVFNAQNTVATVNAIAEMTVLREPVEEETLGRLVRDTLVPSVATSQELSATVSTWWTRQAAHLEQRVYDQVNVGIVQGETLPHLIRRLRGTRAQGFTDGVMDLSRRDASRLVRTQFNAVANTAQMAVYDANARSLRAVKHLSTLDSRTCLAQETPVLTPRGPVPIEQLCVGDTVYSKTGQIRPVVATHARQVTRLAKITCSDGTVITCTPDHPFLMAGMNWVEAGKLQKNQIFEVQDML